MIDFEVVDLPRLKFALQMGTAEPQTPGIAATLNLNPLTTIEWTRAATIGLVVPVRSILASGLVSQALGYGKAAADVYVRSLVGRRLARTIGYSWPSLTIRVRP